MRKVVLAALAVALGASGAMAQERAVVMSPNKKVSVGVQGGLVIPQDVNFSKSASASNSGKIEFKDGYSVGGFAGYQFNDYLRGEAGLSYAKFDYDSVSMDGVGSAKVDGDVKSTIGMISGVVTPLGQSRISPLVGAGVGVAHTKDQASHVGNINVNIDRQTTDLAATGMLGVEGAVTDSVSVGLRYNYYWINSGTDGRDDFTAHNLSATAAVKF